MEEGITPEIVARRRAYIKDQNIDCRAIYEWLWEHQYWDDLIFTVSNHSSSNTRLTTRLMKRCLRRLRAQRCRISSCQFVWRIRRPAMRTRFRLSQIGYWRVHGYRSSTLSNAKRFGH